MKGDCAECHIRGVLEAHSVGDRYREVPWHHHDFRVGCVSGSGTRNAIAHRELARTAPDFLDVSSAGVTQRDLLVEAVPDGLERRDQPLLANTLENLPDQIRAVPRLVHERLLRELHDLPLCPDADERRVVADDDAPCPTTRFRDFGHLDLAGPRML